MNGFTKMDSKNAAMRQDRLVINLQGGEKSGKTHFALTCPGPIAYLDLDVGLEGVVHKFADKKEIYVKSFKFDGLTEAAIKVLWEDFKRSYNEALRDPKIKTVIVDSGTEVWQFVRLARFGRLDKILPVKYQEVNSEMRQLVRDGYAHPKTVVWIHKMKDEYVDNKSTGKMKMDGMGEIPYLVQVNMTTYYDAESRMHHVRIDDCRQNADLFGMELPAVGLGFAEILELIYT